MSRAERAVLASARQLEGLDEEIAVLRARLRSAVDDTPESFRLMVRGMELLAKLVAARYRLSKKAENDLAAHIAGLLRGFAEQFFLVAADDA